MFAQGFLAPRAAMLLIIHIIDKEWNADAEPAAQEAKQKGDEVGHGARRLLDIGQTLVPAMVALDGHGQHWPFRDWVGRLQGDGKRSEWLVLDKHHWGGDRSCDDCLSVMLLLLLLHCVWVDYYLIVLIVLHDLGRLVRDRLTVCDFILIINLLLSFKVVVYLV